MKAKRFEKVLQVRRWKEEEIQSEFAAALEREEQAKSAVAVLGRRVGAAERKLAGRLAEGGLTQNEARILLEYRERLRVELGKAEQAHREQLLLCDRLRDDLALAAKERKVVERVRDRADARQRKTERTVELKDSDEGATLRHARRHP